MLHPKNSRYLKQIFVFAVIWLIFGILYSLIEVGILGRSNFYPATGNPYNFQTNFIFASVGSFIMGLIQGSVEVLWLRKLFESRALWVKIVVKGSFYLLLIILFLMLFTALVSTIKFNDGQFNDAVVNDVKRFMSSFSFWSVIIYISFALNLALFFSEIGDYIGVGILSNYLLGRYHHPNQETRIFMFLDMKSSTTIAENMGHEDYFKLIKAYYADMTNAILETDGEIYQYVGDEIVISWIKRKGLYKNNCLLCYKKIQNRFEKKKSVYMKKFGLVPSFKAGYHIGEVTTGEIGIIKKDIIYTGDVLNTTARIQAECNNYDSKVLISKDLYKQLPKKNGFVFNKIGKLILRGKAEPIKLYRVVF